MPDAATAQRYRSGASIALCTAEYAPKLTPMMQMWPDIAILLRMAQRVPAMMSRCTALPHWRRLASWNALPYPAEPR